MKNENLMLAPHTESAVEFPASKEVRVEQAARKDKAAKDIANLLHNVVPPHKWEFNPPQD